MEINAMQATCAKAQLKFNEISRAIHIPVP
jgi:hypothetical protein